MAYLLQLILLLAIILVFIIIGTVDFRSFRIAGDDTSKAHRKLLNQYLAGVLVASAADWMHGAFVYAVYASYGYSKHESAMFFIVGFSTSAISCLLAGAYADYYGRRTACITYCVLYILVCIVSHFKIFSMLMLGRILGGMASPLLFTAFEVWVVSEHEKRHFDSTYIGKTLSHAAFYDFMIGILCGFVGEALTRAEPLTVLSRPFQIYVGEYLTAFDASAVCCVVAIVLISAVWNENYGFRALGSQVSFFSTISTSFKIIGSNPRVLAIGVVIAFFEASLFIFVFNWTPALTHKMLSGKAEANPPYGLIFALFMLGCMVGARCCLKLGELFPSHVVAVIAILVATAANIALLFVTNLSAKLVLFLLFEVCVGMYYPCIGTVKASLVPEAQRATIYSLFRVPLNLIVIATLPIQSTMTAFKISTACLFVSSVFIIWLSITLCAQEQADPEKLDTVAYNEKLSLTVKKYQIYSNSSSCSSSEDIGGSNEETSPSH